MPDPIHIKALRRPNFVGLAIAGTLALNAGCMMGVMGGYAVAPRLNNNSDRSITLIFDSHDSRESEHLTVTIPPGGFFTHRTIYVNDTADLPTAEVEFTGVPSSRTRIVMSEPNLGYDVSDRSGILEIAPRPAEVTPQ